MKIFCKSTFILFVLFTLIIIKTNAQVSVGLKGEYHFSTVSFDPNTGLNFDFYPGMTFGAVVKVSANPHVGLIAELNYSQKGWIENFSRAGDEGALLNRLQRYRYNYLEVPILTHIYVGGDKMNVFFNLGPHVGFLMGTDSSYTDNILATDTAAYSYQESNAVKFEYGVSAGMGIAVNFGKSTIQLEARLTQGLNNIIDRDAEDAPTGSLNQVAGVTLTYLYTIRSREKTWKNRPDK
ncbi:MAG: hypothetical protein CMO01_26195 [Thalassobius sp.]|nr:hypothetical protein [Thalassovita sp.]